MGDQSKAYESVPLTSGQVSSWLLFLGCPPQTTGVMRAARWIFPHGVHEERVREAVQHVVERHEVLRTTVAKNANGVLEQRIHMLRPVEIDYCERDGITVDNIRDVTREVLAQPIDVMEEWPARWVLGRLASGDHFLILTAHHFALGGRGVSVIREELTQVMDNLRSGRPGKAGLPVCVNPRDIVADELGVKGERARERAREHTREILRSMPSTPFPMDVGGSVDDVGQGRGRLIAGELYSPSLKGSLERLSEQWSLPVSAIALAALSVALGGMIPERNALAWQIYSDRAGTGRQNAAGFEPFISLVSGAGLPGADDLRTAARTVWNRILRTLRHRSYGEDVIAEETFHVSRERRVKVHCPFGFNYVDFGGSYATWYEDDSAGSSTSAPGAETISVEEWDSTPGSFFNCFVFRLPEATKISLYLHEDMLGDNSVDDLLRYIADMITAGSPPPGSDPPSPLPVRAVQPGKGWECLPGGRWVNPSAVGVALKSLPGVEDARAEVVDDGEGAILVASVRTTDGSSRPDDLRRACLGLLDVTGFAVPDTIEIHVDAPSLPAEPARPARALDALTAAVRRVVPSGDFDVRESYFAAGGRHSCVPGLLYGLQESGWDGLAWEELCSHRPLTEVAGAMYRR
ncbi:condensation domain-containing protein [Streptomyces anulatus]|uniref:condensation domain-containing protein n=1 Tax=Streptomyces anulatus TaxID=1892 RepID=UPI001C26B919|nr:condensation domain-containing protein [Streptomyces anulatus]